MKLINGILRPARVLEVLENGCIRVEAPGLFSSEDQSNLPPVYPFFGLHSNTWSAPEINDEVWVLSFSDNERDLHWFRKDDTASTNADLITGEDVEVLCNRPAGMSYAQIYFTSGDGWIIRNDGSTINIRKDGTILLDPGIPHRVIDLCDGSISLGTEGGSQHPAVYGDENQTCLEYIQTALETIKQAAGCNAYTKPISIALGSLPSTIKEQIPKTVSSNVTLD